VHNKRGMFKYFASSKSPIPEHTGIFRLHLEARATLKTADVRDSVKLPPGISEDEWIASQVLGINEELLQLSAILEIFCAEQGCKELTAGKHVTYMWADQQDPTPRKVSSVEYMRTLATYTHDTLSDRTIVPLDGSPFPAAFRTAMVTILKRTFRVYAHAYLHHFDGFQKEDAEAHLNCCFKHFLFFVLEFDLVPEEEMHPLKDLIAKFERNAGRHGSARGRRRRPRQCEDRQKATAEGEHTVAPASAAAASPAPLVKVDTNHKPRVVIVDPEPGAEVA